MDQYLLQTDAQLCQEIHLYGCNFMVLLTCGQLANKVILNADEVMAIFTKAKANNILGKNCYVNNNNALLALGCTVRYKEEGPARFTRLEYSTINPKFNHFLLAYQGKIYNPDPTLTLCECVGIRFYN